MKKTNLNEYLLSKYGKGKDEEIRRKYDSQRQKYIGQGKKQ
jgi:hypothetical protein